MKLIFNVDETALYWKKMPFRTFAVWKRQCLASQDVVTLILGTNIAEDFKLKPVLIYHS